MVSPAISKGMVQQIERASTKRHQKCVLLLEVTYPGDGSSVSTDWWLRKINETLGLMGLSASYADPDDPVRYVRGNGDGADQYQVASLRRKLDEAQLYIEALESGRDVSPVGELTAEQRAEMDVDQRGSHTDERGQIWVDIATAADRIGVSYTTVWRAATGASKNKISAWVVGQTAAGRDRILVQASTWHKHK